MANLLLFSQAIDEATLVVTSQATGFAKEHLQDRRKDTSWKSTSSANQNIDMDFGAAYPVNHCFLYHNLPDNATIRLWAATQANYSDEAAVGAAQVISGRPNLYWNLGVSVNVRYYRFKITTLPSAAEIYLVFMGAELEISIRHDFGGINGENAYSGISLVESMAGIRGARSYYGPRKRWEFGWEYLSLANQQNLQFLISNVYGKRFPFFFRDVDGNYNFARLMMENLGARETNHQLYNVGPLILEEEF